MVVLHCRFCTQTFTKGEHLRRHERSHTGSKPFVCKSCARSFGRQDSLLRHQRLHSKEESRVNERRTTVGDGFEDAVSDTQPNVDRNAFYPAQTYQAAYHEVPRQEHDPSAPLWNLEAPPMEMDFDLIWPDNEQLFQSIMSGEAINNWQLPADDLPITPESRSASAASPQLSSEFLGVRPPSLEEIPLGGSHKAVHDVSKMVSNLSSSVTDDVHTMSLSSIFLDECLHMFFARFIPTLPIVHRSTFVFRECTQPFLLNAIAIGSLYLGPKDAVAKGEALWRLAHTAIATNWQSLITHRATYDVCNGVQLVAAASLGQMYGMLSKNRAIRTTSQAFHSLNFFWARHCGMLDANTYLWEDPPQLDAPATVKEHQWRIWVAKESQKRILLALYVLDGLNAHMMGEPAHERHVTNQLTLSSDEKVFEAATADDWIAQMAIRNMDRTSYRTVFRLLFGPSPEPQSLRSTSSAFSFKVILEGLQSIISDQHDDDGELVLGMPTRQDVGRALARTYDTLIQNPSISSEDRMETLLRWHSICLETIVKSAFLCRWLCERYNIEQYVWTHVKQNRVHLDFPQWISSIQGRRALLHAVAIQDIVEQLPRGRAHTIHMPGSLFAATTVYSIFSLAGVGNLRLPNPVEWRHALQANPHEQHARDSDTLRFVRGDALPKNAANIITRNLLYEMNSMQKLFGCLKTQWGVSADMEAVVSQWISLCH